MNIISFFLRILLPFGEIRPLKGERLNGNSRKHSSLGLKNCEPLEVTVKLDKNSFLEDNLCFLGTLGR